jgi:phytoene dehydrogenase-like protein
VVEVTVRSGFATGVVLEGGEELEAEVVLSNADPKSTFLGMVDAAELPQDFLDDVAAIKMAGPCAKVNFVLSAEPAWAGMPADADANRRSLATLVPTLAEAQAIYDRHRAGEIPDRLWVDCVTASNVDDTLAPPGVHVMTAFVQYVPYELRRGTWDERRGELLGKVVHRIEEHAPGFGRTIEAAQVVTPLDLERTYGLTEGNIFHGDLHVGQLFSMRPTPAWSRYRTPVRGLYLCGSGAHPGGGVTGAPGYGASHAALRDRRRGRRGSWR